MDGALERKELLGIGSTYWPATQLASPFAHLAVTEFELHCILCENLKPNSETPLSLSQPEFAPERESSDKSSGILKYARVPVIFDHNASSCTQIEHR